MFSTAPTLQARTGLYKFILETHSASATMRRFGSRMKLILRRVALAGKIWIPLRSRRHSTRAEDGRRASNWVLKPVQGQGSGCLQQCSLADGHCVCSTAGWRVLQTRNSPPTFFKLYLLENQKSSVPALNINIAAADPTPMESGSVDATAGETRELRNHQIPIPARAKRIREE